MYGFFKFLLFRVVLLQDFRKDFRLEIPSSRAQKMFKKGSKKQIYYIYIYIFLFYKEDSFDVVLEKVYQSHTLYAIFVLNRRLKLPDEQPQQARHAGI